MAEQTAAASSPAEVVDVFGGQNVTLGEFSKYRRDGELPERFKPAGKTESAPVAAPEETVESEGDEPETEPESDPEKAEEPPAKGSGAEKRIKQLLAEKKELQRKLEEAAKPGAPPAPPAAQAAPQTDKEPNIEDKNPDGSNVHKDYEAFVKALGQWAAKREFAEQHKLLQAREAEQKALDSLKTKLDDARSRYEDADTVIFPAADVIQKAQIPNVIKDVIAQSENFPDLVYVLGEDQAELNKFINLARTNPRAALAVVFEYEKGIKEQLAKPDSEPDGGKAPQRKTAAPKPPTPVTGVSSRAFDVNDDSLSPDEWARKRNAQLQKRKG